MRATRTLLLQTLVVGLTLVVTGAGALVLLARNGMLTPAEAQLLATYRLPASRIVDVDGYRLHVADEGDGAVVILMHGSFGSLLDWNEWAASLTENYRVIRFDLPRMGLSSESPDGRYGPERTVRLIESLARSLQLDRFVLVATSSAGESAAAYAAQFPHRLDGLVLSNFAIGPPAADRSHLSAWFRFLIRIDPWFGGWHPPQFWREVIRANFHVPDRVTAAQVRRWTDLNNRAQRMPPRSFSRSDPPPFARTPDDLAQIDTPTLLLWSAHDRELPLESVGRPALAMLGADDKQLTIVPDCGHMMNLECGAPSVMPVRAFLARLGTNATRAADGSTR